MSDLPTTPDREQQKADNNASRRQSGLEPLPRDTEDAGQDRSSSEEAGSAGSTDGAEEHSEEEDRRLHDDPGSTPV